MNVLAIPGSLRQSSFNRALLLNAADLAPEGVDMRLFENLKLVPPFDEDDETGERLPTAVADLRAEVAGADALLIATPEYNSSIPGQLKNAIDWVSRPVGSGAIRGKPVAVVGASTGAFGAIWAQAELRKVLGASGARVVEGDLAVGHAPERFDEHERLTDGELRATLSELLETLVAEARADRQRAPALAA